MKTAKCSLGLSRRGLVARALSVESGRSHVIVAEKQMGVEVEEMVTMPLNSEGRSMTRK